MTPLVKTGRRLDKIVRLILDDYPQDKWVISSIVPLFLEAIKSLTSLKEEEILINKLNQLINGYEFRYGKTFESLIPSLKPYTDIEITDQYIIREFDENIDPIELLWHRDKEDRTLEIIGETDWMIQFDDNLPILLSSHIFIPRGVWHRVIKGAGTLKIKINKS